MTTVLPIHDDDRRIDLLLAVDWTRLPAEPETGLSANVEVNSCRCVEVVTWIGKRAVSAYPGHDGFESLELKLGAECLEKYREQIEAALLDLKPAAVAEEE